MFLFFFLFEFFICISLRVSLGFLLFIVGRKFVGGLFGFSLFFILFDDFGFLRCIWNFCNCFGRRLIVFVFLELFVDFFFELDELEFVFRIWKLNFLCVLLGDDIIVNDLLVLIFVIEFLNFDFFFLFNELILLLKF